MIPRVIDFLSVHRPRGWIGAPAIFLSRPDYRGPVLVRGSRLDGGGNVRFEQGGDFSSVLSLPAGSSWPSGDSTVGVDPPAGWRVATATALITESGCFAYQIDGLGFSYILGFQAVELG